MNAGAEQTNLIEDFKNADFSSQLSIINKTEKTDSNEPFFRSIFEYLTLNMDYYKSPLFDEVYAESSYIVLDYIYRNPGFIKEYNQQLLADSIKGLSDAGIEKTYLILFRIKSQNFPVQIKTAASRAIDNYRGSFYRNISTVTGSDNILEVFEGLSLALKHAGLTTIQKGKLCESSMRNALSHKPADHREEAAAGNILNRCVSFFSQYRWSEADTLVIEYFDQLIAYENVSIIRNEILETINCLGILSTIESARRLNMYLSITNYYVDNGLDYDSVIIGAVINNLGEIGDISSFESLSQVKYSNYTPEIIEMAEKALSMPGFKKR